MNNDPTPGLIPPPRKPWWQSATLIGAFVTISAEATHQLGVSIADLTPDLVDGLLGVTKFIGLVIVIVGRFRARGPIAAPGQKGL